MGTQSKYQISSIAEKYSNISNFFIETLDICSDKNFTDILNDLIPIQTHLLFFLILFFYIIAYHLIFSFC